MVSTKCPSECLAGVMSSNCNNDLVAQGMTSDACEVAPDTVWSYEVGSKNRFRADHHAADHRHHDRLA